MKLFKPMLLASAAFLLLAPAQIQAGVLYPEPAGGWNYIFQGDKRDPGDGASFDALDGTWSHANGSDAWDGSEVGGTLGAGNAPGGVSTFTEGGVTYLRIQDPGNPTQYGFPDPSNRKVYFGHDLTAAGATDTQMDDGITMSFRARIPTSGTLDPVHADGQSAGGAKAYPEHGDGYVTSDGGKGNFVVKQAAGGAIAFSLTTTNDTPGGNPNANRANFAGLTMNEFAGNQNSGSVNFGQGTGTNVIAFNPTEWHEFWIVLRRDPANVGTHQAYIYMDGSLTPTVFKVTAGTGSDYGQSYIAIGSTATPQSSALDIDFVAYKFGAHFPPGFAEPPGGWSYKFEGDKREPGDGASFDALDGTWSHTNGSDAWDGSEVGGTLGAGNAPGGVSTFTEGGVTYLRIQDPGNPTQYGFPDPSNRKVYFGHDLTAAGATDTQMDDGITMSFRARIPTSGTLDPVHADGQSAGGTKPYPEHGDGYVTSDGGKGNFVVKQAAGGAIAFSLTTTNDTPGGNPNANRANFAGLTMNEFAGNQNSGSVNFGQGTGTNVIAFDPTEWHEFWIVLRRDPANVGTHQAFIYMDGNFEPTVFKMTAGTGSDYGQSYIAIGSTATPQSSALDIDFIAYKLGAFFPGNAVDSLPPEILDVVPAQNASFQSASAGISFKATTTGSNRLLPEGFSVTLNGQNLSSNLTVTGTEQNRTATLSGLQPNNVYTGEIVVRDEAGRSSTNRLAFDTFTETGSVVIEAEDYNFSSGQFTDNPPVYGYLETVGTPGVDFSDTSGTPAGGAANIYRTSDPVGTANSADFTRERFTTAGQPEVHVAGIQGGEWLNYTRTIPAGRYHLHIRGGSAGAQPLRIDRVTGDRTQPNQTLSMLGTVDFPNTGNANAFRYGTLRDVNGQPVAVNLSGVTTLRVTAPAATGNINLNYLVLAPAEAPSAPQVTASPAPNATGVLPDQTHRAVIFDGPAAVPASSVKVIVDGQDLTPLAVVTDVPEGVTVSVKPPALLAGGSTHNVRLEFQGGAAEWSFTVADLPVLPGSWGTDAASINGHPRGFAGRIHKVDNAADGALFPNSIARAVNQLAGTIVDPATGQPFANEAAGPNGNGSFTESTAINYEQNGNEEGLPGDLAFPNLDPGDQNYIAMEVITYAELPQGVVRLGVAADDGYVVYAGPSAVAATNVIGVREPGGGTTLSGFNFVVEKAGIYALRLIYFEGTGGADIEWYSENVESGTRALLNTDGSYRTFAARTGDGSSQPSSTSVTIARSGNEIVISWPKTTPAFTLETSPRLAPATWTAVAGTPVESNNTLTMRLPISGTAFFRLKQ